MCDKADHASLAASTRHRVKTPIVTPTNMHVNAINAEDLLCPLWNGTLECDRTDSVDNWPWAAKLRQKQSWQLHGKETAEADHYFLTWYAQPPWDIAEFFDSQYKAIKRMLHLYAHGPMMCQSGCCLSTTVIL
jgi:hypothetical protein